MFYKFLFIRDRKLRRQMIPSPFELNESIVSEIDGFKAIGSPSLETFNNKSRIVKVVLETISKLHIFVFLCCIHSPKFPSHASPSLLDFVANGFCIGVVIEVNGRWKVAYAWFPKSSDVVDGIFFLCREGDVEHLMDGSHDVSTIRI